MIWVQKHFTAYSITTERNAPLFLLLSVVSSDYVVSVACECLISLHYNVTQISLTVFEALANTFKVVLHSTDQHLSLSLALPVFHRCIYL